MGILKNNYINNRKAENQSFIGLSASGLTFGYTLTNKLHSAWVTEWKLEGAIIILHFAANSRKGEAVNSISFWCLWMEGKKFWRHINKRMDGLITTPANEDVAAMLKCVFKFFFKASDGQITQSRLFSIWNFVNGFNLIQTVFFKNGKNMQRCIKIAHKYQNKCHL